MATPEPVLAGVESAMIGSFAQTPDRHKPSLSPGAEQLRAEHFC
ncbi:hypothetical protein [Lamprobacter modestohalophilus]|nr:hypothetical protein [Lamprobacter modestohalophilus]